MPPIRPPTGPTGPAGDDFDDADMKTVVGTSEMWKNEPKPQTSSAGDFDDEGAKTVVASEDQLRSPVAPTPAPRGNMGVGVAQPLSKAAPQPPRAPAKSPAKNEFDEEGLKTVVATDDQLSMPSTGGFLGSMPGPGPGPGPGLPNRPGARSEFAENELKTMVATEEQLSSGPMPALLGVAPSAQQPPPHGFSPAPMHQAPTPSASFAADKVQETLVVPEGYSQSLYQQIPGGGPGAGARPPFPGPGPGHMPGPGPGHMPGAPFVPTGQVPGAVTQARPAPTLGYVLLGLAGLCVMAGVSTLLVLGMPYGILSALMCVGGALVCGGLGYQKLQAAKG